MLSYSINSTMTRMPDPRTDEIAREAARLMESGRAGSVDRAIQQAAKSLRVQGTPLPGPGRVRKHARAMAMQALGDIGYERKRLQVWELAEQVMAVFELSMPDAEMALVGRAAQGHIDADVTLHLRLYTERPINEIADVLETHGYREYSFHTVDALAGRLNRVRFDEGGYSVVITRCPPSMQLSRTDDLFTGQPVAMMGISALRWQLESRGNPE
jgi:hypothetical protein